jgi:hypothetical protein
MKTLNYCSPSNIPKVRQMAISYVKQRVEGVVIQHGMQYKDKVLCLFPVSSHIRDSISSILFLILQNRLLYHHTQYESFRSCEERGCCRREWAQQCQRGGANTAIASLREVENLI